MFVGGRGLDLFAKVKRIGSKRYIYLAEGTREGLRVRLRTLCYLGPLSKLASGVPDGIMRRAEKRRLRVDWNKVNADIRRIPLTVEEVSDARRMLYATAMRARQRGFRGRSQGDLPRARGELSALSRLARSRFREMFETVGDREYRMR